MAGFDADDQSFEDAEILRAAGNSVVRDIGKGRDEIVRQPQHYARYKIEPITFIMENDLPFAVGNIVKYAVRAGSKLYDGQDATQSAITDLEKVRRYAEMRINQLNGEDVL